MTWKNYKKQLKNHIETIYNKGMNTETLILANGQGVSKYDTQARKCKILNSVK